MADEKRKLLIELKVDIEWLNEDHKKRIKEMEDNSINKIKAKYKTLIDEANNKELSNKIAWNETALTLGTDPDSIEIIKSTSSILTRIDSFYYLYDLEHKAIAIQEAHKVKFMMDTTNLIFRTYSRLFNDLEKIEITDNEIEYRISYKDKLLLLEVYDLLVELHKCMLDFEGDYADILFTVDEIGDIGDSIKCIIESTKRTAVKIYEIIPEEIRLHSMAYTFDLTPQEYPVYCKYGNATFFNNKACSTHSLTKKLWDKQSKTFDNEVFRNVIIDVDGLESAYCKYTYSLIKEENELIANINRLEDIKLSEIKELGQLEVFIRNTQPISYKITLEELNRLRKKEDCLYMKVVIQDFVSASIEQILYLFELLDKIGEKSKQDTVKSKIWNMDMEKRKAIKGIEDIEYKIYEDLDELYKTAK